jgi:hypothetical protein
MIKSLVIFFFALFLGVFITVVVISQEHLLF